MNEFIDLDNLRKTFIIFQSLFYIQKKKNHISKLYFFYVKNITKSQKIKCKK
jgi:hypothetical protein